MFAMDSSDERRFAESVRQLRERHGWSQGELARRMAAEGWETYSQMTVSRTEKQERPVRLGEARTLAVILGSSVERMIAQRLDVAEHAAVRALEAVRDRLSYAFDELRASRAMAEDALVRAMATVEHVEQERPLSPPEVDAVAGSIIDNIRHVGVLIATLNPSERGDG